MATRRVDRREIIEMLRRAAGEHGLDLAELYQRGHADTLDAPELRDLWLIWGDVLTEGDTVDPVAVG